MAQRKTDYGKLLIDDFMKIYFGYLFGYPAYRSAPKPPFYLVFGKEDLFKSLLLRW